MARRRPPLRHRRLRPAQAGSPRTPHAVPPAPHRRRGHASRRSRTFESGDDRARASSVPADARQPTAWLYGYAQTDGPTGAGTHLSASIRRPAAAADPLRSRCSTRFAPTTPWCARRRRRRADGRLPLRHDQPGGATERGARLSAEPGDRRRDACSPTLPGGAGAVDADVELAAGRSAATALLYGTSRLDADTVSENRIVRVDPATGGRRPRHDARRSAVAVRLPIRLDSAGAHVRRQLYGFATTVAGFAFVPLRPAGERASPTSRPRRGRRSGRRRRCSVATDGQLYVGTSVSCGAGRSPTVRYDAQLRRREPRRGHGRRGGRLGSLVRSSAPPSQRRRAALYVGAALRLRRRGRCGRSPTTRRAPVCAMSARLRSDRCRSRRWRRSSAVGYGRPRPSRCTARRRGPRRPARLSRRRSARARRAPLDGPCRRRAELRRGRRDQPAPSGGGTLFRLSPDAAPPPALDSDGDGLPNDWEIDLRPRSVLGHRRRRRRRRSRRRRPHQRAGARRRHASARLLHALPRRGRDRRVLPHADRARQPGGGAPATVLLRFLTDTGATVAHDVVVPPALARVDRSGDAARPGQRDVLDGRRSRTPPIVVDRTMTWDATGYGSHAETGARRAVDDVVLRRGLDVGRRSRCSTCCRTRRRPPSTATVRYLRPFGRRRSSGRYTLPPHSRTTIAVDADGAELASTDVSAVITATAPIIVERAMYLQPARPAVRAPATRAPASPRRPSSGSSPRARPATFFDLFVLIANPNADAGDRRGRLPAGRRRRR